MASGALASPAQAANTATYAMTGSVTTICTAGAGGTLAFGTLINGTTGATSVQTPNPTSTDNTAFCNQANTTVRVQRTDLTTTSAASAGFTNTLLITTAKVTSPQNSTGITDNSATGGGTSPGISGTLGAFTQLTVTAAAGAGSGGNSLVANNTYTGTVTITLTPTS
jgi:hypothetical protein